MMSRTDEKKWVQEEIIEAIMKLIEEKKESAEGLSLDEEAAFKRQLKRIQRLFGVYEPKK